MESAQGSMRVRLILGKFRVLDRTELSIRVALGGSTTMTVPAYTSQLAAGATLIGFRPLRELARFGG